MNFDYKKIEFDDGDIITRAEPVNYYTSGENCCLNCKHSECLPHRGPFGIGCWHVSDEVGEDHRWCIDDGNEFRCSDWIHKDTKVTPNLDFWVCRCDWNDYFDFRIIADYGRGHVRVSFYPDEVIISDLFVREDKRGKRYGTALLDYADDLVKKFGEGKQASISALTDWEKDWYVKRGYKIIDE